MNAREIRDALLAGEMSVEEARQAFHDSHAGNSPDSHLEPIQPKRPIQQAPMSISHIQVRDREHLAQVRSDLALVVEGVSMEHEYERQMMEERARHVVAMPAVALLGVADGVLEAVGYGISEILESFTYALIRTVRRAREGFERGKRQ